MGNIDIFIVNKIDKMKDNFIQTTSLCPNIILLGHKQYIDLREKISAFDFCFDFGEYMQYRGMGIIEVNLNDYIFVGFGYSQQGEIKNG